MYVDQPLVVCAKKSIRSHQMGLQLFGGSSFVCSAPEVRVGMELSQAPSLSITYTQRHEAILRGFWDPDLSITHTRRHEVTLQGLRDPDVVRLQPTEVQSPFVRRAGRLKAFQVGQVRVGLLLTPAAAANHSMHIKVLSIRYVSASSSLQLQPPITACT
jgi:hypothetical protein